MALCVAVVLVFVSSRGSAQLSESWAVRYDGPGRGDDEATAVAVDSYGNVCVTGFSWGGSPGTPSISDDAAAGTGYDFYTAKYSPDGVLLWSDRYRGFDAGDSRDKAWDIELDSGDNIYVAGPSESPHADWDFVVVKYDPDGMREWVARYDGLGRARDKCVALALDGQGNSYVTGSSPGLGPYADFATVKFGPDGEFVWDARYSGPSDSPDHAQDIAVHCDGSVYVTGCGDAWGVVDYVTIKYSSDGEEEWVATYTGTGTGWDMAYDIALDASGNAYVTGWSSGSGTGPDYLTIKYDSEGHEEWVARYDGGPYFDSDYAHDLAVDSGGNVYVTGHSQRTYVGFEYTTLKYNTDGDLLWEARYGEGGPCSLGDVAYTVGVDPLGNVLVAGKDCGYTDYDCATVKYSPDGAELWCAAYQAEPDDEGVGLDVALGAGGEVYIAGSCDCDGTAKDFLVLKYSNSTGITESETPVPRLRLSDASPNPFRSETQAILYLARSHERISVDITNVRGQIVRTLDLGISGGRTRPLSWDGTDQAGRPLASGVYFMRASNGRSEATRKVVLVR